MANETVDVGSRIRRFILKHFPLARKQSSIEDDSPLLDTGIIDSLGVLDLVSFIEKEFKITISEEDLMAENFESITSMMAFVQSKGNGQLTP
ncbi:MAG: acyl carrier protein [Deltaproteobacteria bacterium]|nr:acyl carrier protein [Deltaproteobacteria bacterium]